MVKYYYSKEHDILVSAQSRDEAKEYVDYRMSPAYGFDGTRTFEGMGFRKVSASEAEDLSGWAIVWEAS